MRLTIILYLFIFSNFISLGQTNKRDVVLSPITITNNFKIDSISKELNYTKGSVISFYIFFSFNKKSVIVDCKIRGENQKINNEIIHYFKDNYAEVIEKRNLSFKNKYTLPIVVRIEK